MIASRTIAAPPARMTRPPAVRDGLMSRTSPRSRSSTTMPRPIDLMHIVRSGTFGAGMEAGIVDVSNRLPEDFRVSLCALAPLQTFSDFLKRPGTQFFTLPPRRPEGVDWMLAPRLARRFRQAEVDLVHSHN